MTVDLSRSQADAPAPTYLDEATSTQQVLAEKWRSGSIEPLTSVIADYQMLGRGRLDRTWVAPPRSSLLASTVVALTANDSNREFIGWITLAAALAARDAIASVSDSDRVLIKWPNDVVVKADACRADHRGFKIAGILAEFLGERDGKLWAAIGCGINLTQGAHDLPVANSTSLLITEPGLAERTFGDLRDQLFEQYRQGLAQRLSAFDRTEGPAHLLIAEIHEHSADIGETITVRIPCAQGVESITGIARRILTDGSIELDTMAGPVTVTPGDVAMLAKESHD